MSTDGDDVDPKLSMNVFFNKQRSKVLFAEANSEVVDVLLSFLTLPLGRIQWILDLCNGQFWEDIGSLASLYRGLVDLDSSHFCVAGAKRMLQYPKSLLELECSRLKLNVLFNRPRFVYFCQDSKCPSSLACNVSMHSDIAECDCGKPLNREILVDDLQVRDADADAGAFITNKSASFIICDDLRVVPVVSGFLQTLTNLGITDTDGAEMETISINLDDIMHLLSCSFVSATPLTDLVLKYYHQMNSTAAKVEPRLSLHHIQNVDACSRKLILKIFLQKSTNKFLLAEATEEFVEFLFSLLGITLGGVEYLLGGNTGLKNMDNLYKSVRDVFSNKYFESSDAKNRLMNPKLPQGYISRNQPLPLSEEDLELRVGCDKLVFKPREGKGKFMKEETMYIVSDDLTVTPFTITSSIGIPLGLGVSLSDVKEKDFQIGLEEALSILHASLSSTTALTDALINPMLNKQPKQARSV